MKSRSDYRELGQQSRLSCQLLGVFQRALQDEPRHRVDIHGGDLAAEAHSFQRDGTPPPAKGSSTLGARPP